MYITRKVSRKNILATATALTASYADIGSAINIEGMSNLTLHMKQGTAAVDALVKAFLFPTAATAPTATTNGFQLVTGTTGVELEPTVLDGEYAAYSLLGVSGKYIYFQAKNSSGTVGTLQAFLTGNRLFRNGHIVTPLSEALCTATELTSSYADIGTVATSIHGSGDITLHVTESGGTDNALITVFVSSSGAAPSATTTMGQVIDVAGAEIEYKVLLSESASIPLTGVSGKHIMIKAKDAGDGSGHATIAVRVSGNVISI